MFSLLFPFLFFPFLPSFSFLSISSSSFFLLSFYFFFFLPLPLFSSFFLSLFKKELGREKERKTKECIKVLDVSKCGPSGDSENIYNCRIQFRSLTCLSFFFFISFFLFRSHFLFLFISFFFFRRKLSSFLPSDRYLSS